MTFKKGECGYKWNVDTRQRRSLRYRGAGNPRFGKHCSEETKKKIGEKTRKLRVNKETLLKLYHRQKLSCSQIGNHYHVNAETVRRKLKEFKIYRKLPSQAMLGQKFSSRHRKKISETRIRRGLSKGKLNPMSKAETVKKWFRAIGMKPNNTELKLLALLHKYISDDWKFVGAGDLIISNKCPDFSNGNGKLIELYGDYFHRGENPQERIDLFKKVGFDTLVIWEHELKDEGQVVERILEFNSQEG